jgi:hypothetical protein
MGSQILKDYLLKGFAIHLRGDKIERKLIEHDQMFELIINTGLKPTEGIFCDGQIFDAWQFASNLIKEAEESIILIDNYIEESVLNLLTKRKTGVSAKVFTARITKHRGQRSEVRGRKSEVRGQKSEVRGRMSEVRGRKSEVGSQRSEVRGRKSEVRGRKSEVRGRKSEVRGQRSEVGSRKSEIRNQMSDSDSYRNRSQ